MSGRLGMLDRLRGEADAEVLYTALFSNTALAHQLDRTADWMVIYLDDGREGQWTVVTESRGPLAGRRVVRGREAECQADYGAR